MKIPNATISGFKPLEKAADMLKMNNLKSLSLKNVNLSFEFDNGRVYVQPFEIEQHGIKMTVSGSNGFDLSIDYLIQMDVPRELLGPANTMVNGLLSKAAEKGVNVNVSKTVGVKVRMTGQVNDPKVDVSLASMTDGAGDDLKQQALDELERRKKELEDKARAEAEKAKAELERQRQEAEARAKAELDKKKQQAKAEADKILADAQVQANRIKAEAKNAADLIRKEGDANANKLVAEAGSNPIKKAAAEKAAQGIRKQANDKAAQLEQEANQRADNLMAEARRKADEKLK
jgi:cell division septum initiation protein DivIVA